MNDDIKKKKLIDPLEYEKSAPNNGENKLINPMIFDVPTKSPEEKIFLVLVYIESNDELVDGSFKICYGRTGCYRYIQSLIEAYGTDVDVHQSKVITETKQTETETGDSKYYFINYLDALSIYSFCKAVESNYAEDGFSIDNYFSPPASDTDGITSEIHKFNRQAELAAIYSTEDPEMAKVMLEAFNERHIVNVLDSSNGESVNV